jgi:hypothetical protein
VLAITLAAPIVAAVLIIILMLLLLTAAFLAPDGWEPPQWMQRRPAPPTPPDRWQLPPTSELTAAHLANHARPFAPGESFAFASSSSAIAGGEGQQERHAHREPKGNKY